MKRFIGIGLTFAALTIAGCGSSDTGESKYLLSAEPPGAKNVVDVRKNAKDNDDVVIVGRVGGEEDPWVEGLAAFSIGDLSMKACNEIEGDTCPVPWDFCCEPDLPDKIALIQIVDDKGNDVEQGAKKLLGLKELDTVVVRGTAKRDDKGNLTVIAKAVYIRKRFPW